MASATLNLGGNATRPTSPHVLERFAPVSIRRRHPWLDIRDKTVVLGDDLDSVMSAVLMHHLLGWRVGGFYTDYTRVWHLSGTAARELREAIWLDVDVSQGDIRSISHHILVSSDADNLACHRQSVNPNLFRGVTAKPGSGHNADHGENCPCGGRTFPHKYPLGTVHFLLWLYAVGLGRLNALQTGLLWLPDSSWINGQSHRFRKNVADWVSNWIPHPSLVATLDRIDTARFEREMRDTVMPAIAATGFGRGTGQVASHRLRLGGYQCQFGDPNRNYPQIQALADMLSATFGWSRLVIPAPPYLVIEGKRNSVKRTLASVRRDFGSLGRFLVVQRVFSCVIPNGGKVNYTTRIVL